MIKIKSQNQKQTKKIKPKQQYRSTSTTTPPRKWHHQQGEQNKNKQIRKARKILITRDVNRI